MSNLPQIFNYQDQEVRTVTDEKGKPWFVASDVCRILEIKNASQALNRLKENQRGVILNEGSVNKHELAIVSEPGLYKLVLKSRKKEAEIFQDWITEKVLPEIRKTGSYNSVPRIEPDFTLEEALKIAYENTKALRETRDQLAIAEKEKDIISLEKKKIEKELVRAEAEADILHQMLSKYKDKLFSVRELSDEFNIPGMGQDNLFKFLREEKILFKSDGSNFPMQTFKDKGYFVTKQVKITIRDREEYRPKPLATVKGMYYVARKLQKAGFMDMGQLSEIKKKYFGKEEKNLKMEF